LRFPGRKRTGSRSPGGRTAQRQAAQNARPFPPECWTFYQPCRRGANNVLHNSAVRREIFEGRNQQEIGPATRSAKLVRQAGPPSRSAKLLRQSESATQRAPTAGDDLTPPGTCRSSHRSVLISRGSNSHRHRRHRQRGPPTRSANPLRQPAPPTRSAKSLRQVAPPSRSAKSLRQLTPPSCSASQRAPTRERQLPVTISPRQEPPDRRITARRLVAAQTRTARGTANLVRQPGPPNDTAKVRRQSESAN